MNKMIKAAGLGLLVLSSSMFANAAEAAQKIGYVNTAQVFQALPQREVTMQKMQKEFKAKSDELKSIRAQAKTKVEKLQRDGELLGQDEIEKLRVDIAKLESEYKVKAQAIDKSYKEREAKETQKLFKVIQTAIDKVAKQKGYDLVIDAQAVRFAKPEYNISEDVIKALK
ncbi:OmpH family outer membrane protein [Vibrio owensii]|uniref:OmpH family outer membrane protein n=1 Tax=Vibrio owensii TaxID=696485 RepID=UPI00148BE7BA|nr:OmpH family outer membrane protein [Vibrio owensii]